MSKEVVVLNVEGMSCSHCENSVKKSVGALDGVENVTIDLEGKKVTVQYDSDKASVQSLKDAIEEQGFDVID